MKNNNQFSQWQQKFENGVDKGFIILFIGLLFLMGLPLMIGIIILISKILG
jgi:hypothetical protein